MGQKNPRKIPSKFPTKFSKFPCEKSKKITDELLQERRDELEALMLTIGAGYLMRSKRFPR